MTAPLPPLDPALLPPGLRSRFVDDVNGLRMHLLEAGEPGAPLLLLLHGFPELAYSWRKVMPALAALGHHVVAPDQRGYGRTTGWDPRYDGDLLSFRMLNLVRDALGLVVALGHDHVAAVIGHDFGSPVAGWCATVRPDVFRAVAMMSAPFAGGGDLKAITAPQRPDPIHAALAALPRPRRHYQHYYSDPAANADMLDAPQGLHAFLRAYYHVKSADWPGNRPYRLTGWTAEEAAKLPTYYVMDQGRTMPETVAPAMPSAQAVATNRWLPDREMAVYAAEYARSGFQGGLQWYRCASHPVCLAEQQTWAGRPITVPSTFIAGEADWGIHQRPGQLDRMQALCGDFRGLALVPGAGHWVQQEQPVAVVERLAAFLAEARA